MWFMQQTQGKNMKFGKFFGLINFSLLSLQGESIFHIIVPQLYKKERIMMSVTVWEALTQC
jgi:hypothetical protein